MLTVVRQRAAHHLESGTFRGLLGRTLSAVWTPIARKTLVRPGRVPDEVAVVCVGGATVGGSGKTRVAIACAKELAREDARPRRVALVSHGYRSARLAGARIVDSDAALKDVGDEAIVCARALAGTPHASVVVGPSRQEAIDFAVRELAANVIVLDGPLRIAHAKKCLSLLAVDAREPWGSAQRVMPAGDLRGPIDALRSLADRMVTVDAAPSEQVIRELLQASNGKPMGLFTALARPQRLVDGLASRGLSVETVVSISDHGPLEVGLAEHLRRTQDVAWIATDKCALHLEHAGIAHNVIPNDLVLDEECRLRLTALR